MSPERKDRTIVAPNAADQFEHEMVNGKKAYVAYAAIWSNGGMHTMLACPTLERLEYAYRQITGAGLNKARAARVLVANGGTK